MRVKTLLCIVGLCLAASLVFCEVEKTESEPYVEQFDSAFSVRTLLYYSFMRFAEDDKDANEFLSNRPLDLGFGASWKGLSAKFSFSLPFAYNGAFTKTESLDIQVQYYGANFLADAFLKKHRGLRPSLDYREGREIDMEVLFAGLGAQYIFNSERHSLKAVYNLTARQARPAGSLLVGGAAYFVSAFSYDGVIEKYKERRNFLFAGPNTGYSYTWGFANRMFLNVSLSIGANIGIELNTARVFFSPAAFPSLAVGYHGRTWSCSLAASGIFLPLNTDLRVNDTLMTGKAALTFVKRF